MKINEPLLYFRSRGAWPTLALDVEISRAPCLAPLSLYYLDGLTLCVLADT
jgi:hypothetical protein